ncbi:MAG: hypothetical protein DI538_19240 [Azospira oryzae]|nr:MAG: hypothetical protein DI538_19240 [Azospira oryzae]
MMKAINVIFQFGDQTTATFDDIYLAFHDRMVFFARTLIADDANDIVQDCFVKILVNPEGFESFKHVQNTLYLAIRRDCEKFLRKRTFHAGKAKVIESEILTAHAQAEHRSEILGYVVDIIERELVDLGRLDKEIIRLAMQGFRNMEIAVLLDRTEKTIRNRKSEVLDVLKSRLTENELLLAVIIGRVLE